jgi:hypothetical protein
MAADQVPLLRHAVATLAYRAGKVLRDFPPAAVDMRLSTAARTPLQLVDHLGDLMEWAESLARGGDRWAPAPAGGWDAAVARFFRGLSALDAALAAGHPDARPPEQILQGPVADALTHVGQLALLRGLSGAPVRPESFARAEIVAGRVGQTQAAPRKEFDGDAGQRRREGPAPAR